MTSDRRVPVRTQADIVVARQTGRQLAAETGFKGSELTLIATAISEIARNIIDYAGSGEVCFEVLDHGGRHGLRVVAADQGPGIEDIGRAMQDGYTSGRGLGLGLPGARRLMDEFELQSELGRGTTITMTRWLHARR